jgi:hypothetical protein
LAGDFLAVRPDVRLRFVAFLRPDDAAAARPVLAAVFRPTAFFAPALAPVFFAALFAVDRVPVRDVGRVVALDDDFAAERDVERGDVRLVRVADFAADFVPFRAVGRAAVRVVFDPVRALAFEPRRAAVPVFAAARPRAAVPRDAVLRVLFVAAVRAVLFFAAVRAVLFFAAVRAVLFFAAVRAVLFFAVVRAVLFAAVRLPRDVVVPDFAALPRVVARPAEPDARRVAPAFAPDARPLAVLRAELLAPDTRRDAPLFADAVRRAAPRFAAPAEVRRAGDAVSSLLRARVAPAFRVRVAPVLRMPVRGVLRGLAGSAASSAVSSAALALSSLDSRAVSSLSLSSDVRFTNLKNRLVLSPIESW